MLLRPLPYPDADRIVQVFQNIERPNIGTPLRVGLTPDQFQIWRDEADAVSHIAVHGVRTYTLTGVGDAVRLNGASVTPSFFPCWVSLPCWAGHSNLKRHNQARHRWSSSAKQPGNDISVEIPTSWIDC